MKLYRFGIRFDSKFELAAVLGLPPYSGKPLMQDGVKCRYLSERDIIQRLIKGGSCDNELEAVKLFTILVDRYRNNATPQAIKGLPCQA